MVSSKDPNQQSDFLQQCLSSSKRPLGIFLGAGCPMAVKAEGNQPLIPDIVGMTKVIREQISGCEECLPLLTAIVTNLSNDGTISPTVEDMLTHVRGLRAVAGQEAVRNLKAVDLDKLDTKICDLIHLLADKELPASNTPYHELATWVNATLREGAVEIFTTNYDLLMEQAFEDSHVPYFDGFAGSRKPFFDLRAMEEDSIPPRWARLWKLHGSINWYHDQARGVQRGAAKEQGLKRVIHPSHMKYEESRRMPYLAMIDRLRAFLKRPSAVLIVCGYSFRDEHLNEVIVQGLQGNQTATAFALLFDPIAEYAAGMKLASRRSNLSLLAKDGAVIGGSKTSWIEKEADSILPNGSLWVTWNPVESGNANGRHVAQFNLGDFHIFGQFLAGLVGPTRHAAESEHAS